MGKILALDIGEKRIGYAVSDEGRTVAFPRGVFSMTSASSFLRELKKFIEDENIAEVVIGVALGEDNEETPSSIRSRAMGKKIQAATGVLVHCVDEFGTTSEALSKIPLRRDRRRSNMDDALAAQIILKRFLNS